MDELIDSHLATPQRMGDGLDALIDQHLAQLQPQQPSGTEAALRGAGQGFTLGFGDELNGGVQAIGDKLSGSDKPFGELYRRNRDMFRREDKAAQDAHPYIYGAAQVAGSVPATFVPGLGAAKGAGLTRTLLAAGAQGGLNALGDSSADLTQGNLRGAALDTGIGTGAGLVAGGVGKLLSRGGAKAAQKVVDIDETVARKAAADAASQTASARSAAGSAAQDTYRQLEHLRELNGKGLLSPEGQKMAADLEAELAQKAADKLPESFARKQATAAAYSEALSSEGHRAKKLAADKLSGAEFKSQVGARLLRYGLPAAGGAAAGYFGLGGVHGAVEGAGAGAMAGAGFRPMMHSLKRLAASPVVQRPVQQAIAGTLDALAPAASRSAGGVGGLTSETEADLRQRALIQALLSKDSP
jgi:hypothetical protein